eukprot:COSAG05_NODE_2885_length_2539_cov_8.832787_2_plen_191_part_00
MTVYSQPGICTVDPHRGRAYHSSCDTSASCPRPPDGLVLTHMPSSACPVVGQRTYFALASEDMGRCIGRPVGAVPANSIDHSPTAIYDSSGGALIPAEALALRYCCNGTHAFLYFFKDRGCMGRLDSYSGPAPPPPVDGSPAPPPRFGVVRVPLTSLSLSLARSLCACARSVVAYAISLSVSLFARRSCS